MKRGIGHNVLDQLLKVQQDFQEKGPLPVTTRQSLGTLDEFLFT